MAPQPQQRQEPRILRIFISYGHDQHSVLVTRVQRDLQQLGHETWFDAKDIEHGDDWRRRITDGLHRTDAVLAFLIQRSIYLDKLRLIGRRLHIQHNGE